MTTNNISFEYAGNQYVIGEGAPTFIIAEVSANHQGSLSRAKKIVQAAIDAGADAIKLQSYTPDTMTIDSTKEEFMIRNNELWEGKNLYELYKEAQTPWEWHEELRDIVYDAGRVFFSSPFGASAVDLLEGLDVPIYKIASFESTDPTLLRKVAGTNKPVIISRGVSDEKDIQFFLNELRSHGCKDIALLHCVSSYPADPEQMNLATIPDMAIRYSVLTGLSDHTLGLAVPIASVGLGAHIIEKHLTLKRSDGGPDAAFSLEPDEFKQLVDSIRIVEKAIGKPTYNIGLEEQKSKLFRRSIYAIKDIKKGETFTEENIRIIRPGHGLDPKVYYVLLGKRSLRDIEAATPITKNDFN